MHWLYVVNEFYAPGTIQLHPLNPEIEKLAKTYKDPHKWAGQGMTAQKIALEPDTQELDANGNGITFKFQYEVLFRWTSHYVHPSIVALYSHLVEPGREQFRVHANKQSEVEFADMTMSNVVSCLGQITTQFFRGMGDSYGERIGTYALRLLEALSRR